jgi:dual specificity phosphatase 12
MKKQNVRLEKALWTVKAKRRQVNPNLGFIKQLEAFELRLFAPADNSSRIQ